MRDETFKKLRSMWWVKCAGSDLCLGAIFMVMGLMIPMSGLLRMVDHWVNGSTQQLLSAVIPAIGCSIILLAMCAVRCCCDREYLWRSYLATVEEQRARGRAGLSTMHVPLP